MTPKPVAKANLIDQQILGSLLANKQTVRTERRGKRAKNGQWTESDVDVPTSTLAGNVSNFNVERIARRVLVGS
ncbi:hypothetical protein A5747_13465 [Mycobacterium sp. IS-836]|nr:hypothetical protein A5747_13465 [Mycobacterium sp. IS-836]